MADQYIQVPADDVGKKVDTSELTVNGQTVERQRVVIADPSNASNLAEVDPYGNVNAIEGASSPLLEVLDKMLWQLRAIRLTLVALVCEDGSNQEQDFDPAYMAGERSDLV